MDVQSDDETFEQSAQQNNLETHDSVEDVGFLEEDLMPIVIESNNNAETKRFETSKV
jgi:hypothetical protein